MSDFMSGVVASLGILVELYLMCYYEPGVNILPRTENASFHVEMHSLLLDLFILAGEGLKD